MKNFNRALASLALAAAASLPAPVMAQPGTMTCRDGTVVPRRIGGCLRHQGIGNSLGTGPAVTATVSLGDPLAVTAAIDIANIDLMLDLTLPILPELPASPSLPP